MTLDIPLRRDNLDQYSISFMGPSIWNKLSNSLKILNTENELTLDYKKLVLKNLNKWNITSFTTSITIIVKLLLLSLLLLLLLLLFESLLFFIAVVIIVIIITITVVIIITIIVVIISINKLILIFPLVGKGSRGTLTETRA